MKCPYCGIHYMDDDRECPICGKRPGLLAPKKEKPAPMTAEYPKIEPPKRRNRARIPREGAPERIPPESGAGTGGFAGERKKKGGIGCLVVFAIILIFIITSLACSVVVMNAIGDYSTDYAYDEDENLYVDAEILDALSPGTWQEEGGGRTVTIREDGSVSWSDASGTYDADYVDFEYLNLTEENASLYCTDEELEAYPLEAYAQYTLYLSDWDSDTDSFYLCIYLPAGEAAEARTSFDAYDYDTYTYTSFTLVADEGAAEDAPANTLAFGKR